MVAVRAKLDESKADIVAEYFRRTQLADQEREHETAAAVRIQSVWRAHVTRRLLSEWHGNGLHIARIYRGHLGRLVAGEAQRARRIHWQRVYFSQCATSIQKWCAHIRLPQLSNLSPSSPAVADTHRGKGGGPWARAGAPFASRTAARCGLRVTTCHRALLPHRFRAYHSRRYKHNYYARKAYIRAVLDKSETLRRENAELLQSQVDDAIAANELKARGEVEALSVKLHHLVSTKTTAGIYNSPMHDGFLPTAFSIPIETHLRNAIKPQLREELQRSLKGKLTNTKPKLSLAAGAVAGAQRDPYVSQTDRRKEEERAAKHAFVGGTFHTSTQQNRNFSAPPQSIMATEPYIDGGTLTLARTANKTSWIASKVRSRAASERDRAVCALGTA